MSSDGLELREVSAGFGEVQAVAGVDLAVAPGEILALLGPSGCGKSTLLRCIAGLQPLQSGAVTWNGVDLAGTPTHRRGVGLMFQHHALFPHRTVAQNIEFGLRMQRVAGSRRAARVTELLQLVGLEGFEGRTIDTLSGGEAQRVALARALAPEPRVLLLDEPLGSLDRALRDHLVDEVRRVIKAVGITAVHVTHDQDEAATVADRVALMRSGSIARVGDLEHMIRDPRDIQTARFLGIETVWVTRRDRDGRLTTPFGEIDGRSGPAHEEAAILVRPEHVTLRVGETGGVAATVMSNRRSPIGWIARCRLASGETIAAAGPARLPEGTAVTLNLATAEAEILAP